MLADPRHSRVLLIHPARCVAYEVAQYSEEWLSSMSLLSAAHDIFGIRTCVVGANDATGLAESDTFFSVADVDPWRLWRDGSDALSFATGEAGIVFLGGAWLEEDVLIAALEAGAQGYDVRVLADLSVPRREADRPLAFNRLALHGIPTMTVRQALLEWALSCGGPAAMGRVGQLLSR
ncbi:hypothetical protein ACVIGA_007706 [Bradyrhizobium sp. USDA 3240]